MVILRARVGNMNGDTEPEHCTEAIRNEGCVEGDYDVFRPQWVEIEQSSTGFILVSVDDKGWRYIETSSASIEEAQADAAEQFSVDVDAWLPVSGEVA